MVAPARERGLKFLGIQSFAIDNSVAPARERGLKYLHNCFITLTYNGRSREGAWIEIDLRRWRNFGRMVAPARERGLKLLGKRRIHKLRRRSREGAWIEIRNKDYKDLGLSSLPRGSVD